jgi:arylsulfatase A-like enzyme
MEAPPEFLPRAMTSDQLREIDALTHVENELIDEACGRVLDRIREKGWEADTDVLFTTDHGELQGDFGLLFKGPYHVDALMRIPLIWRPAPNAGIAPAVVDAPVGQVDFAPTFCQIAGLDAPDWMQGRALPQHQTEADTQDRQRVLTEWDSDFDGDTLHLRTIYRDGYTCTVYERSSLYEGSEGELYDHSRDPLQRENLWSDPAYASVRSDLVADLYDNLPAEPDVRAEVVAPV